MTTLEKIREEIAEIAPLDYPCDKRTPERIRDMALEIIDRYAEPISIEKIRAEIDCYLKNNEFGTEYRNDIKNIIDKYAEQETTGHWIAEDMFDGDVAYRCSECNELFWIESGTPKDNEYNFCPKCGKKLVEPQERR